MRLKDRKHRRQRKWMLFPLMDLFFIILLFFLVVSTGGIQKEEKELLGKNALIPVSGIGKVQVVLQMIDANNVLWLDNSSFNISGWSSNFEAFIEQNTMETSIDAIKSKLTIMREESNCMSDRIVAVLRTPPDLTFEEVYRFQHNLDTSMIMTLKEHELQVCPLEGVIDDIRPDRITVGDESRVRISWGDKQ